MQPTYEDIIDVMGTPVWYHTTGYPRYKQFLPDAVDIYATFGLLTLHGCQSCTFTWLCGSAWDKYNWNARNQTGKPRENKIAEVAAYFSYGDPPSHACMGATMGTATLAIVRAFERPSTRTVGDGFKWQRVPEVEVINPLDNDGWATRALEDDPDRWDFGPKDSYRADW